MGIDLLGIQYKADILAEALPYIRKFSGKSIVVKYGGNAMIDPELKKGFAEDIVLLKLVGMNPVVVHGGGPQIDQALKRLGKQGEFVQGMRVTDQDTMLIVEMVLGGHINKEIVSLINHSGGRAVGLTGRDSHFIRANKLFLNDEITAEKIDIGLVGEVKSIDVDIIELLDTQDFIPVIAPIGVDEYGQAYNINADIVAGKLAEKMQAEKLILMTNTPGVLDKDNHLLAQLTAHEIETLFAEGTIHGGMRPKIQSAIDAAHNGVKSVHIIDGRVKHALLIEILTNQGVGTMIMQKEEE
jgi:acetylglutamate kinase